MKNFENIFLKIDIQSAHNKVLWCIDSSYYQTLLCSVAACTMDPRLAHNKTNWILGLHVRKKGRYKDITSLVQTLKVGDSLYFLAYLSFLAI